MPDILTPTTSATAAKYSYYLVDIVTNTALAQIPFEDVSYERSLKQAGQFTGKITTTAQTDNLDLYNSTMPGKTALYVMRNDKCVWGGIVWSRGYDMVGRSLTVSASEFTSYFNRRHIWKTYTYTFEAELTKINKTDRVKVSLKNKTLRVPFATQDSAGNKTKVYVSFSDANLIKYGDYYNIVQDDSSQEPTQTTFYVNVPKLPASASAYAGVTISARVDTYDYVRELLKDIAIDFSDVDFTNETITPGVKQQSTITYRSCSDNEVAVTTSEKHNFVTGQVVDIKNLEKALNGKYKVTSIPTPYQFKYSIPVYNIKYVKREDNIATVYVNTSGGTNIVKIPVGASIVIAATTYTSFNGTKTVVGTTDSSFSYVDVGGDSGGKLSDTGSITVPNIAINGSELNPANYRVQSRKIQSTGRKGVTHVIRQAGKVTMWTKTDHGFKKADKVAISIKVTSSDTNDKYKSLNNSDIPIVVTSVTSRSFSYYQDDQSDTKNDIKNKDDSRVELKTTKKNTAQLAVPVKKLILKTVDTHTYEVGDYLYVTGVDGYDWTTPLYNGYKTIEELDTDSATICNRERTSGGKTTIYTADNHGYDVGDMVVISGMADATFNGTFKIISVYDPANASNGEAYFRFYGVAGSSVAKAGSNSNYGVANTYGDSWVAFGMPEYGTVKEPDDVIPLSKRSYSTTGRIVTMFTSKRHGLSVGDKIRVSVDADKNEVYEGLFTVQTVPREDYFTYKLSEDAKNLPTKDFKYQETGGSITRVESKVGFYPRVSATIGRVGRKNNTATVYANSHAFIVGDSITVSMSGTTYDSFENSENTFKVTEVLDDDRFTYASVGSDVGKKIITNKARSGTTATLTTSVAHGYAVGEQVYVSGVDSKLNGSYTITAVNAGAKTFSYTTATSATGSTPISSSNAIAYSTIDASGTAYIDYQPHGTVEEVTYAVKTGTYATLTIEDHSYRVGDYVVVYIYTASKESYNNGNKPVKITAVTANTISYTATSATSVAGASVTGRVSYSAQVEKRPIVVGRTYGEFPENSDLGGLDFSETTYSNNTYQNSIIRGSDLTNVAQLLETYSNTTNGFDYRVDCSVDYDQYGNKIFKRSFTLIPRTPVSLSDYLSNLPDGKLSTGTYAPPSAFGADKYVFEYPGNVSNFNMSENSSDSATRMFVVGSNDDLGGEGGARFSAASATDLLNAGWPILDKSEKQEWPLVGIDVINVDNWGNYDAELDFNKTAERYLNESKPPMGDFVVTVNGSLNPVVGTYNPGDWCSLRINDAFFKSRLASILEPRKDVVVRKIDTIKVNVPNNPAFPEQIDLTLVPEWQVDSIGK
jgi:hypothetical protein